ncbi:purple acid phosphatase 3-like [Panicum miliaceum]|uniref:Purple acid phosphatase 3-like n=1 Tax=Panicum miliaceum TaxID=4540 RepID=A0A3L6THQ8_PANMI|nr:purple acid phosphatase 3-like [Panicum miliaceum]
MKKKVEEEAIMEEGEEIGLAGDGEGRGGARHRTSSCPPTGDNFYETGLTGVDDQRCSSNPSQTSTQPRAYRSHGTLFWEIMTVSDALAQFSPVLRKIDSRFICKRSFIVNAVLNPPKENHYDWRGVANLLKDLDEAMKKSTAKWKIAVGHHTMRSVSRHGDTEELLQLLLPILKVNGIDFYINGHNHCLEHISRRDSPIQYFTSGGGSSAWR